MKGEIISVDKLDDVSIDRMYELMFTHYSNMNYDVFQKDLSEKDNVVLLHADGNIQGFSTMMTLEQNIEGNVIRALFSGDTIIHRDYWGSQELPKHWARHALSLAQQDDTDLYWFLISKGYKTYRYLPLFFKEYWPNQKSEMPSKERKILDAFATYKFNGLYDSENGVIRFDTVKDCLRCGVADIDRRRRKNPHVRYFEEKNPGWQKGDELACLTSLSLDNFKKPILKWLK